MIFVTLLLAPPVLVLAPVLFLQTIDRALREISPSNRRMSRAVVWLNLIPVFHVHWAFVTVDRLSDSLTSEFEDRGIDRRYAWRSGTGRTAGAWLAWSIFTAELMLVFSLLKLWSGRDLFGSFRMFFLASIPAGICIIIYWVQLAGAISRLKAAGRRDELETDGASTAIRELDRR